MGTPHPCGYGAAMPIAHSVTTMLDCPDPIALAEFYSQLTGAPIAHVTEQDGRPHWVVIGSEGRAVLAFQRVEGHRRPDWPDGDVPQQMHLDIDVSDLDEAERVVLDLGAVKADYQPSSNPQENFRVFLDPAGHPFCLVSI